MLCDKHIMMIRQTGLPGAQNIVSLCNVLSERGYRVTLVTLDGASDRCGLNDSVKMQSLGSGRAGRFGASRILRKILKKTDCDLIYVLDSWTIPVFWLATLGALRVKGKPLIYHTFDWLEPGEVSFVYRWLEKTLCRSADLVVNTDRARARMQRTLYAMDQTPLWIQNALSAKIQIPAADVAVKSQMLGRAPRADEKVVIYPTVISEGSSDERCVPDLIRSLKNVSANFSLVLFGKDGKELLRCKQIVAEMGLGQRVHFIPPVSFAELVTYVRNSDYGVILYNDEKSSGYFMCNADKLSLYAACGVPYLASNYPNLESITYKYQLGICCNSDDVQSIAKGLSELLDRFPGGEAQRFEIQSVFEENLCLEKNIEPLIVALSSL